MGNNSKIALARFRIANLEQIIKDIQARHQADKEMLSYVDRMPPKRTSTSEAPTMTQAAIKKLVADSVSAALEAQAANMANTDNTTRPREAHIAKKNISYKIPMTCQPINFKGTQRAIDYPLNSFAQPIGIEEAYKITWVEFKKLLIKKYCPRSEVQKMEDEFYHLIVKGNDIKAYVRRFRIGNPNMLTMVPRF
ncbi:hypothetical protein Tco_1068562 [Tanacetum coccineum]|uniref:Reverse transcriptase domain-containing protein n=1 Tax=Tanacetum coccineum TaxID=301880 RepID=A0ABQ5HGK3_9ASTR